MKTNWPIKKLPRAPSHPVLALVSVATVCLLAATAHAADIAETVRRGNEALAQGKFDEALATYQQAAADEPARAEVLYNQAVAHYRNGEYEQARGLFTQATASDNRQLDAKARFNLADCDYAEAVQLAEKDKPAAIERLRRAISHYRGALQSSPGEGDARANIELAQMLIKQLQEEGTQQDQQKQDHSDNNQQDNQQKSDQNQQQNDEQQNKDEQKQSPSDKSQQQEQSNEKNKPDEKEGKQESKPSESQKQEQKQETKEQQDQPANSPRDKQQEQEQPDSQQATQQQSEQQQDDGQAQQSYGAPQFGSQLTAEQEARPMTKEEAQKMLQAVRDRDLMRRLEQLEQRQSRHVPVDKDW